MYSAGTVKSFYYVKISLQLSTIGRRPVDALFLEDLKDLVEVGL